MGLNFKEIDPIPHLTSPLKGEELDKLALMGFSGESAVMELSTSFHKFTHVFFKLQASDVDLGCYNDHTC